MKKVFAISFLICFFIFPVVASGVVEGGLSGASLGTSIAPGVGTLIGGVLGGIAGGIFGSLNADKRKAEIDSQIENINLQNEQLLAENEVYNTALGAWQNQYDATIGSDVFNMENNLNELKDNFGAVNTALSARGQSGATARLLAQEQKDRIVSLFGNDMALNTDEVSGAVKDYFDGNMNSLSLIKSNNYGLYERQLIDTMASLRQDKKTMESQVAINERAIQANKYAISDLKSQRDKSWLEIVL